MSFSSRHHRSSSNKLATAFGLSRGLWRLASGGKGHRSRVNLVIGLGEGCKSGSGYKARRLERNHGYLSELGGCTVERMGIGGGRFDHRVENYRTE